MTRQSWEQFYRDEVASLFGVNRDSVRLVQRHDPVKAHLDGKVVAEGFCAELEFSSNGKNHTVYAWDEPPFVAYKKAGPIKGPSDALLAFFAERRGRAK